MMGSFGLLPDTSCEGRLQIAGDRWPVAASKLWRKRLRTEVCVIIQDPKAALDPLASGIHAHAQPVVPNVVVSQP